ncbi:phage tail sheath subtilisin-like domain-containing protein [Aeromonas enteropelogenes]|uniref:phage tail sheath subtilisin-like domain-containing protein n=1 Tax=Aeromonas enteropelogenes TaxID=29489 RepID=UPI003BA2ED91
MSAFSQIPDKARLPLTYIEINNRASGRGLAAALETVLMFGQPLTELAATLDVQPTEISSPATARELYGTGSQLAQMATRFLTLNKTARLYCLPVLPGLTAAAATGSITLTGPATANGTLCVMIAGQQVQLGVQIGDDGDVLAPLLADAINAVATLPVTAAVDETDTTLVTLTAKWKGESGNDLDIRLNYYASQRTPAGLTVAIEQMAGGSTSPALDDAIAALGNTWYTRLVNPFTDESNLALLSTELLERWGPVQMIDGIAFQSFRGNYGETAAFGESRNDFLFSTMGSGLAPTPPWELAAINCAVASAALAIDPARPLQTLALTGFVPPANSDCWEWSERNQLLYDGISTYSVDDAGVAHIDRQITMYREDEYGNADDSYLDVNTISTLSYIRYVTKTRIEGKFGRMKLADDGTNFAPGSPIVTPAIIKEELLALFRELETAGLVEGWEQYKDELIVERDEDDRNRVNVYASQNIVNAFRIYAQAINYIG